MIRNNLGLIWGCWLSRFEFLNNLSKVFWVVVRGRACWFHIWRIGLLQTSCCYSWCLDTTCRHRHPLFSQLDDAILLWEFRVPHLLFRNSLLGWFAWFINCAPGRLFLKVLEVPEIPFEIFKSECFQILNIDAAFELGEFRDLLLLLAFLEQILACRGWLLASKFLFFFHQFVVVK